MDSAIDRPTNRDMYAHAIAYWIHSAQERWQILYNYFMAATIMVAGWGAVFSSANQSWERTTAMIALSLLEIITSIGWWAMMYRTWRFVEMYGAFGGNLERRIVPGLVGVFIAGQQLREELKNIDAWWPKRALVHRTTASGFSMFIPKIFTLAFVVLLVVSCGSGWRSNLAQAAPQPSTDSSVMSKEGSPGNNRIQRPRMRHRGELPSFRPRFDMRRSGD